MVRSVVTRFILIWIDHLYFYSSVASATVNLLLDALSRGYERAREGRVPKSLCVVILRDYVSSARYLTNLTEYRCSTASSFRWANPPSFID